MMVSSRMVKPHIVKKWAIPGTVHWSSLRWPATSVISASALGDSGPRVRSGAGCPARIRRDNQWKRRPAMARAMTVTAMPIAILTGTGPPRARSQVVSGVSNMSGDSAMWRIPLKPHTGFAPRSAAEIVGVTARGRPPLALILGAEAGRTVGPVGRRGHLQEADLADLHAGIEGDRKVGDVRELQGQVAVPSGIDEPGGGVDEQAQAPERRLPLQPGDQIPRKGDPLHRRAQHKLAGVEDQGILHAHVDQLGQVLLVLTDVDNPLRVVPEEAEVLVHVEVDRGRLDAVCPKRVDDDPACLELLPNRPV